MAWGKRFLEPLVSRSSHETLRNLDCFRIEVEIPNGSPRFPPRLVTLTQADSSFDKILMGYSNGWYTRFGVRIGEN